MSEERLEEVRAGLACDQRSSRMPKRMEPQRPQSRRVSGARVAPADGGAIEPATEARAEEVIVATRVVATVRRRYTRARDAAGLRPLRFHALRHAAGSLVAREAGAHFVQAFLGHSRLSTTERYLHAKSRPQDVETLNRAFAFVQATEETRSR